MQAVVSWQWLANTNAVTISRIPWQGSAGPFSEGELREPTLARICRAVIDSARDSRSPGHLIKSVSLLLLPKVETFEYTKGLTQLGLSFLDGIFLPDDWLGVVTSSQRKYVISIS